LYELCSYHGDHTARSDTLIHAKHRHVISIVTPPEEILISHVVGVIIHHPAPTLYSARVTATQVGGEVTTVTHTLIRATLEVSVLIENYLF